MTKHILSTVTYSWESVCYFGSRFSFVALDHLLYGTQVRMRMVRSPFESLLENHHMDSGQLLQSKTSLLYFEGENNPKKARERMRLEGNRVTTACRTNTLLNQSPLIAAEFFGIRLQENPIHTILWKKKIGRIDYRFISLCNWLGSFD